MAPRRCPLFGPDLDLSPQSLALDWLHDVSLGIVPDTCAAVVASLARENVFSMPTTTLEQTMRQTVNKLDSLHSAWCKEQRALGRLPTEVHLEVSKFGTVNEPTCKMKGAQGNYFLEFLAVCCFIQILLGRRYLLENPAYSDIFTKSPLQHLRDNHPTVAPG